MNFRITGRITERESGLGVRGLNVRAYDRDLLFDDLLGTVTTDAEGRFEMVYAEKDFRELFEKRPDVYLSIYAPPFKSLFDTKDSIRWGARELEHFELQIDSERLGALAPTRSDDEVVGGFALKMDAVQIVKRAGFDLPRIPCFVDGGEPGGPTLPEAVQYVALPLGGDVLNFEVIPGDPVHLPGIVNPFPFQDAFPDVGTDPKQFGDGFSTHNIAIGFTPLSHKFIEDQQPYPKKLAELIMIEEIGAIQVAVVRIRPLQYDPKVKSFIFYPGLRYSLKFDIEKARRIGQERKMKGVGVSPHYAEMIGKMLKSDLVISVKDLIWPPHLTFPEEVPHVIITDNYSWPESVTNSDGTVRAPVLSERGPQLAGDMVAEFEGLAMWKTARGIRSRVVTVSDVISGKFGDFTQGGFTRDLQEVLRNFLKYIHKRWNTLYLLLAGDVNVIPMRKLVGCSTYKTVGCGRCTDNPPIEGTCHFLSDTNVVKLFPLLQPSSSDPLCTMSGGLLIPFDREAGSGRLGWYFTNEDDFKNKNQGFTRLPVGQRSRFVIVEGPAVVIDDDYYWCRDVNSIPSDFYYASLEGPGYSLIGKHDFDSNNNGMYGQYYWDSAIYRDVPLDGVDSWSDIWIGRASVECGDEARAFINKLLTYERLESPVGNQPVDPTYLQKILYAADYWGCKRQILQIDSSHPPAEGRFTHAAGTNLTKVHAEMDMSLTASVPSYRLVACFANSKIVIPYNTSANASSLGWFFVTHDDYDTQSATPTRFVRVMGSEEDVNPSYFIWDPVGLEQAIAEKENLRNMMNGLYPNFKSVERHYADYFDLSSPPPIFPLDADTINAALDSGVHLVCLSGHGSPGGCCGVSSDHNFTNDRKYFIAFANSCSTARPDGYDSLAEKSLNDPNGGGIAYVGNTRYGWTGVGDNYEEFFWRKLRSMGNLGAAAGMRMATGGVFSMWTIYAQNLFGDPEMPIWSDLPSLQEVTHPDEVAWGGSVTVTVRKLGEPVGDHLVTLMGGWTNSSVRPPVLISKATNPFGQVSFNLPTSGTKPSQVSVVVTSGNFKPYRGTIRVI